MRRRHDSRRLFLSVVGGITFALALLFGAGAFSPEEARAQAAAQPKYFDPVTRKEAEVFKKIVERSYSADELKRIGARNILERQALRTIPRFAPAVLASGGLAAAAVGSWTVVGLELYYLPCWECSAENVRVAQEVKPSADALLLTGLHSSDYSKSTQMFVTYAKVVRNPSGDYRIDMRGFARVINWRKITGSDGVTKWYQSPPSATLGLRTSTGSSVSGQVPADLQLSVLNPDGSVPTGSSPPLYKSLLTAAVTGSNTSARFDLRTTGVHNGEASTATKSVTVCPSSPVECNWSKAYSTLDFGSVREGGSYTGSPLKATPQESNDFINSVVSDPAVPEVVPDEDVPQYEPDPDWDPNTDPFSPLFDPFEDPEGDPDRDGVPNRTDDDPEGDGDPDGDGDPNEHPRPVPFPQTDDPEHDGDPDGDGDPDETNPYQPQPDPYDPETAPNEDPDSDGIPNEYDPDPVNPTDPGTLSPDNPYADPDTDGEPNRQDEDDDGDGIPDQDDPQPYTPTDPESLPNDHPYADPDHDGTPNKDDPDDDGDGVPDTEDPSPHDPSKPDDAPQADPDGDGQPNDQDEDDDGDGTPDVDDPAPYDPGKPGDQTGPEGDRDDDGTPDATDPEPDNPDVPEGGPDGDPDGDGSPNKWDPAPTDPSNPEGGPQGDPDGDGVPNTQDPAPNDPSNPGNQTGGDCPVPREASFELPKLNVANVFPFSLVVWGWEAMGQLSAAPKAPVFDLGVIGVVDFSRSPAAQSMASLARTCIWLVGGVGMAFVFYAWIRSGSS